MAGLVGGVDDRADAWSSGQRRSASTVMRPLASSVAPPAGAPSSVTTRRLRRARRRRCRRRIAPRVQRAVGGRRQRLVAQLPAPGSRRPRPPSSPRRRRTSCTGWPDRAARLRSRRVGGDELVGVGAGRQRQRRRPGAVDVGTAERLAVAFQLLNSPATATAGRGAVSRRRCRKRCGMTPPSPVGVTPPSSPPEPPPPPAMSPPPPSEPRW